MKKLVFTILSLFLFTAFFAQSPVYVLFNTDCMDQLEYKYTRSNESVFAYSFRPNAEEQYIFMSGSSGIPQPNLPVGTFNCNSLHMTDAAVKFINEQTDSPQMYVLIQQQTGYLMMPVYSITQIKRYGSWYLLVGPQYTFAVDTMELNYQKSLQGEASSSIIRFAGAQLANCRYQYKFHGEPARGYTESTDFDFIYGIGIVKSRTGSNSAELEESEMRLNSVNEQYFDAYMASICPQQNNQQYSANNTPGRANPTALSNYIYGQPVNANPSTNGQQQTDPNTNKTGYSPSLTNCPTPPGAGYHIVQPRESLNAIARTYNVDVNSLVKWNNIKNPDQIEICQQIWLQKPPAKSAPIKYSYQRQPDIQYTTHTSQEKVMPPPQVANVLNTQPEQQQLSNSPNKYYNNYIEPASPDKEQQADLPPAKEYIVRQGETLNSIAIRHKMSLPELASLNGLAQDDKVPAGKRLTVRDYSSGPTPTINNAIPEKAAPQTYSTAFIPIVDASTPPESSDGNKQHIVKEGEDLAQIAQRYGYTSDYFRHINSVLKYKLPTDDYTSLSPGLVLTISDCDCQRGLFRDYKPSASETKVTPPVSAVAAGPLGKTFISFYDNPMDTRKPPIAQPQAQSRTYIVKKIGETLASIALEHNLKIDKLVAANNIRPSQNLKPGKVLIIPQ